MFVTQPISLNTVVVLWTDCPDSGGGVVTVVTRLVPNTRESTRLKRRLPSEGEDTRVEGPVPTEREYTRVEG